MSAMKVKLPVATAEMPVPSRDPADIHPGSRVQSMRDSALGVDNQDTIAFDLAVSYRQRRRGLIGGGACPVTPDEHWRPRTRTSRAVRAGERR